MSSSPLKKPTTRTSVIGSKGTYQRRIHPTMRKLNERGEEMVYHVTKGWRKA